VKLWGHFIGPVSAEYLPKLTIRPKDDYFFSVVFLLPFLDEKMAVFGNKT
jgi:hypothetical protein